MFHYDKTGKVDKALKTNYLQWHTVILGQADHLILADKSPLGKWTTARHFWNKCWQYNIFTHNLSQLMFITFDQIDWGIVLTILNVPHWGEFGHFIFGKWSECLANISYTTANC